MFFIVVFRRICVVMLAVFFLSGSDCGGHNNSNPATVIQKPQVEWINKTAASCNGGAGATPTSMKGNAQILANLIATFRGDDVGGSTNTINVGVAQWQAKNMSANNAVSLVGSDGEDALMRITCSGGTASTTTGVIAVGVSTNPQAVMNSLQNDINSSTMIQAFAPSTTKGTIGTISVGYDNGYWMIILQ
jgi:hypothetical protein